MVAVILWRMSEGTPIVRSLSLIHSCHCLGDNVGNITVITVPLISILAGALMSSSFALEVSLTVSKMTLFICVIGFICQSFVPLRCASVELCVRPVQLLVFFRAHVRACLPLTNRMAVT